jgi:hypothetical protein
MRVEASHLSDPHDKLLPGCTASNARRPAGTKRVQAEVADLELHLPLAQLLLDAVEELGILEGRIADRATQRTVEPGVIERHERAECGGSRVLRSPGIEKQLRQSVAKIVRTGDMWQRGQVACGLRARSEHRIAA